MSDATPAPGATVLVVEDEEPIKELIRTLLTMRGYRVLAADSAAAGLSHSEQEPGPISLLITDMRMPGMSGQELAERLLTSRQTLRVLYISGSPGGDRAVPTGATTIAFLAKPFNPRQLVDAVTRLLAS